MAVSDLLLEHARRWWESERSISTELWARQAYYLRCFTLAFGAFVGLIFVEMKGDAAVLVAAVNLQPLALFTVGAMVPSGVTWMTAFTMLLGVRPVRTHTAADRATFMDPLLAVTGGEPRLVEEEERRHIYSALGAAVHEAQRGNLEMQRRLDRIASLMLAASLQGVVGAVLYLVAAAMEHASK